MRGTDVARMTLPRSGSLRPASHRFSPGGNSNSTSRACIGVAEDKDLHLQSVWLLAGDHPPAAEPMERLKNNYIEVITQ